MNALFLQSSCCVRLCQLPAQLVVVCLLAGLLPACRDTESSGRRVDATPCLYLDPSLDLPREIALVPINGNPRPVGYFLHAAIDLMSLGVALVDDVTLACQAIAIDLGEDADIAPSPRESAATLWCLAASHAVGARLGARHLSFQHSRPRCLVEPGAVASCEADCSKDAACVVDSASLDGQCEDERLLRCDGGCDGSCEGSASQGVRCEGRCLGSCQGSCDGKAPTDEVGGRAPCDGTCNGVCWGSCTPDAGPTPCPALCAGHCTGESTASWCSGAFTPPEERCKTSEVCRAACRAIAMVSATCSLPVVDVAFDTAPLSADDLRLLTTLEANLPTLLLVANARQDGQLVANALLDKGSFEVRAEQPLTSEAKNCLEVVLAGLRWVGWFMTKTSRIAAEALWPLVSDSSATPG